MSDEIKIPEEIIGKAWQASVDAQKSVSAGVSCEIAYQIIARWMREEAINEALAEARDCGCANKIAERIAKIGQ